MYKYYYYIIRFPGQVCWERYGSLTTTPTQLLKNLQKCQSKMTRVVVPNRLPFFNAVRRSWGWNRIP